MGRDFPNRCDRNVLRSGIFQSILRPANIVTCFRENGNEDVAFRDAVFVTFGFEFGYAETDQTTGDSADGGTGCRTAESGEKRTCGDERTDTRNCQRADAGKQAEGSAKHAAGSGACHGTFGRLGVFLMGKLMGGLFVGEENGDVVRGEP